MVIKSITHQVNKDKYRTNNDVSTEENTPLPDIQNSFQASTLGVVQEVDGGSAGDDWPRDLIGAKGAGTLRPGSPLSTESPYLDVGDNVHANVQTWLESNCGTIDDQWFLPGVCENGHRIAKVIVCGKEWCPRCGQKGSMAHNRRYVRWLPKIQQFKRMRYIVFTIPEGIRANYRTKESLTVLGRKVQELLKHQGFPRGLRRWHWFGDRSHKWHPHLNVLVEGGYMNGKTLQNIKTGYAKILGADTVSVRTTYKPKPGDMASSLLYVTRATFHDYNWDMDMAIELRNFRNMCVWGKGLWDDPPAWSLNQIKERMNQDTGESINVEAIEKIVNHTCHICGGHLTWDKVLPGQLLNIMEKESLGAGYYRIIDRPSPDLKDTVDTVCNYKARAHPGGHVNRTYDGMHYHHQRLAKKKLDYITENERRWNEILNKIESADG